MGMVGEVFALAGLHIDSASFSKYGTELKAAEGKISDFSSTSQSILAGAFTLPAVALGSIISYGTELASGFEDASTTLTTLYGDLDVAKEKFTWLSDFAASTPFEFPELMDATIKLKAYGIEAQQYLGILGDTASAMGKPLEASVEALADAQTGEFERLKEFGIKAAEITKKNYQAMGATIEQVGKTGLMYTDKYGKQQLAIVDRNNREMITSTITSIWNDKYQGAMEARSRTLSGMMSTLKDNLTMGLADIVGFDMKNMEVQTLSILGVFKELTSVAVDLTGSLSSIPEPLQAIMTVGALGAAGIGLLAAGFIAYNAILPIATAETTIFGFTLSAAIWPVTAVVAGLALVAGGMVLLEEKTGLVSDALSVFSDLLTVWWGGLKDFGSLVLGVFSDIYEGLSIFYNQIAEVLDFSKIDTKLPDFGIIDGLHELAEGYRNDGETIKTAVTETGEAVTDAETVADDAHGLWRASAEDFAAGLKTSYNDVANSATTSASQAESAWDKAFKEMQKDYDNMRVATEVEGLKTKDPKLINSLSKGIQGNGEILGLNNDQELVIQSFDGVVTKLNELDSTQTRVFNGIDKNYAIIIDDGSKTIDKLDQEAIKYREMGYEVLVVASDMSTLNGQSLGNVTNQAIGLDTVVKGGSTSAQILKGDLSAVDGQPMSNIITQITGVDSAIDTGATKAGNWQTSLINVNNTPFSLVQGNIGATGVATDTGTTKAYDWNTAFAAVNAAPFGTILGNINTTGIFIGNDTTKTGELNSTLLKTNTSPFGTLFGNLVTGGVKVGDLKKKTDETNSSMSTLGNFSFSSTLSSLGSIWSKLGDIYDRAKSAVSELGKIGSSSGGSSGSSGSSVTKNSNNKTSNSTTNNYYVAAYKPNTMSSAEIISGIKRASGG